MLLLRVFLRQLKLAPRRLQEETLFALVRKHHRKTQDPRPKTSGAEAPGASRTPHAASRTPMRFLPALTCGALYASKPPSLQASTPPSLKPSAS